MGRNLLPYMQFDVDDYLQDEAVMGMDADTEGLYIRLLCRSWKSATPGVIPERLFGVMCEEHRITEQYRVLWGDKFRELDETMLEIGPEMIADLRLESIKDQMRPAFDTVSRPGFWVQKRMMADFKRLSAIYEAKRRGGEQTRNRKQVARSPEAILEDTSRTPGEEVEVEVEKEVEESKSKDLATDVAETGGSLNGKADPEDLSWGEIFETWFWGRYPRKVGKPAAKKAWNGVRPQTQDTVEAMNEGLGLWEGFWAKKDKEFIPHPATWLNQRRWEDQP
jgi:uncharacterized protein YdaU (DUF1376 family)